MAAVSAGTDFNVVLVVFTVQPLQMAPQLSVQQRSFISSFCKFIGKPVVMWQPSGNQEEIV